MITLQITQDQLQNPKTAEALKELISHLGGYDTPQISEVKKKKSRTYSEMSPEFVINPEVIEKMEGIVSKKKALLFISLLKEHGTISSHNLSAMMKSAFPDFQPRAMGGITGAVARWVRESSKSPVFISYKNHYGETYFRWLGFPK